MAKDDLLYNGSGLPDPTAYEAIKHVEGERDTEKERYLRLRGCILRICEIGGFKIEGPLVLKDLRNGKVWR